MSELVAGAAASAPLPKDDRRHLQALAHHLKPVVQVGSGGLTEPVFAAVRAALLDHELIKVRLQNPDDKRALGTALAAASASTLCALVGHTVILYRPHPKTPRIELPGKVIKGRLTRGTKPKAIACRKR